MWLLIRLSGDYLYHPNHISYHCDYISTRYNPNIVMMMNLLLYKTHSALLKSDSAIPVF